MKIISNNATDDSPVYTFVKDLKPPMLTVAQAIASAAATLPLQTGSIFDLAAGSTGNPTLSVLMQQAEKALQKENFIEAKTLYASLHEKVPNDVSVVHKLTLATYKAKIPTEMEALKEARQLLDGLNPGESTDTETLGLLQAVEKRLWNLAGDRSDLEKAIWSSEKAFYLKNDFYNGINLAFLYNVRASVSEGPDAVTDFVLAQRTRRRVVVICQALLDAVKSGAAAKRLDRDTTYWALATLAEAWAGLGDEAESQKYLTQALGLEPPPAKWMIESTQEQLKKLGELLTNSPLKSG